MTTHPGKKPTRYESKVVECAVLQDAPRSRRHSGRADSMVPELPLRRKQSKCPVSRLTGQVGTGTAFRQRPFRRALGAVDNRRSTLFVRVRAARALQCAALNGGFVASNFAAASSAFGPTAAGISRFLNGGSSFRGCAIGRHYGRRRTGLRPHSLAADADQR